MTMGEMFPELVTGYYDAKRRCRQCSQPENHMTPAPKASLTLTPHEARDTIDELAGGNIHSVFAWDGSDDPADARTRALAKLFKVCGHKIPDELKDC
jgi:hypothetical protein